MNMQATTYNEEQRQNWNVLAQPWDRWGNEFERGAAAVSDVILKMAAPKPGDCVLDIATGLGDLALTVARLVGPTGRVTGIDIAEDMIAIARRRKESVQNVYFLAADAQDHLPDGMYDLIFSRFGLMFMPGRLQLLKLLQERLSPSGRLVFSTWSTPDKVPMISSAVGFFARELNLPPPPPDKPGPFSMSNPSVVVSELEAMGFHDVRTEHVTAPFKFESTQEFVNFSKDLLPPSISSTIAQRATTTQIDALWEKFQVSMYRFRQPDGVITLPSTAFCFFATR